MGELKCESGMLKEALLVDRLAMLDVTLHGAYKLLERSEGGGMVHWDLLRKFCEYDSVRRELPGQEVDEAKRDG
jgi:hypothetical protein